MREDGIGGPVPRDYGMMLENVKRTFLAAVMPWMII